MQAAPVQSLFPTVVKRRREAIDPEMLKVEHNVPLPGGRSATAGKYHALFSLMLPGSSVRCEVGEINQIASSLRKQIELGRYPALKGCAVRSAARCEDGHARVWALKV